jgi:hypothetical protein
MGTKRKPTGTRIVNLLKVQVHDVSMIHTPVYIPRVRSKRSFKRKWEGGRGRGGGGGEGERGRGEGEGGTPSLTV